MAPDSNDGKLPVITSKFLQVSSPSSRLQVCPCKNHSEELNGLYNLVFVLKLSVKWLLHALLGIDTNLSHVMGDRQHYHNLKNSHSKCLQCQTLPKKKKKKYYIGHNHYIDILMILGFWFGSLGPCSASFQDKQHQYTSLA